MTLILGGEATRETYVRAISLSYFVTLVAMHTLFMILLLEFESSAKQAAVLLLSFWRMVTIQVLVA